MADNAPAPQPADKPTHAIRMTFEFDGGDVKLVSQQRVEMTLPASDPVQGHEGQKGFWYELRNAQNRTLFRRVAHPPMRPDVEVFSPDPNKTLSRQPAPNRKGVFVALVPDNAEGQDVVLSASPPVPTPAPPAKGAPATLARVSEPAREFARFRVAK